jgi:MinD superfamily P-loop ATPase
MKIAIASGKGGTGKTTLSTNLAVMIAQNLNKNVTLVDLDVEEPNSKLFIDVDLYKTEEVSVMVPQWDANLCSNCGKCKGICEFNALVGLKNSVMIFPELCHNCYLCSDLCPTNALPMKPHRIGMLNEFKKEKLHFIEGVLDVGVEQAVPLIKAVKKYALNNEFVIFDCPPGTSHPVIESVNGVDLVILVTEPSPFGFNDLVLAIETMKVLKKKFVVVINRADNIYKDINEYCKKENIEIIAEIPDSRKIAELYSNGKLIYNEISEELNKIYDYIIGYSCTVEAMAPPRL